MQAFAYCLLVAAMARTRMMTVLAAAMKLSILLLVSTHH